MITVERRWVSPASCKYRVYPSTHPDNLPPPPWHPATEFPDFIKAALVITFIAGLSNSDHYEFTEEEWKNLFDKVNYAAELKAQLSIKGQMPHASKRKRKI